jgi:hypothetical protein
MVQTSEMRGFFAALRMTISSTDFNDNLKVQINDSLKYRLRTRLALLSGLAGGAAGGGPAFLGDLVGAADG